MSKFCRVRYWFISRLKAPIGLFSFPFLFPSYCHRVVHRVLSFVSGGCTVSSFVCLYIVFESSYRCINAIFNAGKCSSTLFSWNLLSINVVSGMQWKFTKLFAQMWHKAIWKGHPMRLELTRVGLLVELADYYTTGGALKFTKLFA